MPERHDLAVETPASISVVIPFGKLEGNVERCVRSALAQGLAPLEVIVVANHGVDIGTARRVLQALADDTRLRVIDGAACRNANEARNLGAAEAQGQWLALLDSDDWWESSHLAASLAAAHATTSALDLVYGSIVAHKAGGAEVLAAHHFSASGGAENYLLSYFPAQTSSYFMRRGLMLEEPWDPTLMRHQDYEWFARVARRCSVGVNTEATVHVEWLSERRHKAHRDCWRVVSSWRSRVRHVNFRRHHRRLIISALRSKDIFLFSLVLSYLIVPFGHPDSTKTQ